MSTLIFPAVWFACSRAAYHLFRNNWLRDFNFTKGDRAALTFLSLFGPFSLAAALIIWAVSRDGADEVLIPRKGGDR